MSLIMMGKIIEKYKIQAIWYDRDRFNLVGLLKVYRQTTLDEFGIGE